MPLPLLAAYALLAAGTAAKYKANNDVLKKQDEDAAQGIRERTALQDAAAGKVQQNIAQIDKGGAAEQTKDTQNQYLQALRASQARRTPAPVFGGSQRFAQDQSAADNTTNAQGVALAQNLAQVDAPLQQRANESDAMANTASGINDLNRAASVNDYLTRLRMSTRKPNGWLTAGGEILQGLGSGAAGTAGAAADAGADVYGGGTTSPATAYGPQRGRGWQEGGVM